MSISPDGIYEKGIIDPGEPVAHSTKPYWLTEPSPIHSLQSQWQGEADVVIIGSGMTAASLCRTLYAKKPGIKIVLVEARDLCSGATGRNGGHCKAMSPGSWIDRKKAYGTKEALKVMWFEHSHVDEKLGVIEEHGIDCNATRVEGLDVYHDQKTWRRAINAVEDMARLDPALGKLYTIYSTRSELRKLKISDHAVGAIGMKAATLWPYKMVAGLLKKFVDENGLNIQTNTVVKLIEESQDYATVKTTRGDIKAPHVVHATNAFMSHLVPEIRPYVSPVRANVQRQLPRPSTHKLTRSYWLRFGEKDYDYMMQRPDGATIIGRSSTGRRATADDSETDLVAQVHLRGASPLVFDWGTDKIDVTHQWSGGVAFTQDGNPFVGRIPFTNNTKPHQWICGCYVGIGMVKAFKSAQQLAYLMLGEKVPEEYPESHLTTEKRFNDMQTLFQASAVYRESKL